MMWQLKRPMYWLDAVEQLRLSRGGHAPIRPAALWLHELITAQTVDWGVECETLGGKRVYPKVTESLAEVISANTLADMAVHLTRGERERVRLGPRRVRVTHHPDAKRRTDPSAGKMKITVAEGAPLLVFDSGTIPCPWLYPYVDGTQINRVIKTVRGDSSARSPRYDDADFIALKDRVKATVLLLDKRAARGDPIEGIPQALLGELLAAEVSSKMSIQERTVRDALAYWTTHPLQ